MKVYNKYQRSSRPVAPNPINMICPELDTLQIRSPLRPPLSWLSQSTLAHRYMYNYTTVGYLSDLSGDLILVLVPSNRVMSGHFQHSDASNDYSVLATPIYICRMFS